MTPFYLKAAVASLLVASAVSTATAREISSAEALARIEAELVSGRSAMPAPARRAVADRSFRCVATETLQLNGEDKPAFYVFNSTADASFLILTADDRLRPVLAVGDSGAMDMENLPPSTRWWLDQYREQIAFYIENNPYAPAWEAPQGHTDHAVVSYLVKSLWSQSDPYYDNCPAVGGQRCVTGCVATAMAQVVNYHKFANPTGNHTYTTRTRGLRVTFNYSRWTPDFDLMLNDYSGSYSAASATAVSKLMSACGVAVDMDYTPEASGASSSIIGTGLKQYMGYSSQTAFYPRGLFNENDWESLCYNAIAQGYPLIYCGTGNNGGHCFVCDGYEGSGLFHINWGWAGAGPDGAYALTALNPEILGTGGGGGGFNYMQDVVVAVPGDGNHNYQAPQDVDVQPYYITDMEVFDNNNFGVGILCSLETDGPAFLYGYRIADTNGKNVAMNVVYGLDGLSVGTMYPAENLTYPLSDVDVSDLDNGTYYLIPIWLPQGAETWGEMKDLPSYESEVKGLELKVSGGRISTWEYWLGNNEPEEPARIEIVDITPLSAFSNTGTTVTLTLMNPTNRAFTFTGFLALGHRAEGSNRWELDFIDSNDVMEAGESREYILNQYGMDWNPGMYSLAIGLYNSGDQTWNALEYYDYAFEVKAESGITEIDIEDEGETICFNLHGQRIVKPTSGLYIEKRKGKARKYAL